MGITGHGPNIGHGFVKYVAITAEGVELEPVVFPAMVGRAGRRVAGAIADIDVVEHDGQTWWVGEDALLAAAPLTILAQERLRDANFIPALVRAALQRVGGLDVLGQGYCVTGLPATWASDTDKARLLGDHLRAAHAGYSGIRVIPEPLGLLYAAALDCHGQLAGDPALLSGTVGIVDLGHHTVDVAVIRRLAPVPTSLDTWTLGTARPLQQIRALLSAAVEREVTLYEADLAVRVGEVRVRGRRQPLPTGWDRPLIANGDAIVARLTEAWGSGSHCDHILIGGGGAEVAPLAAAIQARFPHAAVVLGPQTAVARGYARLARRLGV